MDLLLLVKHEFSMQILYVTSYFCDFSFLENQECEGYEFSFSLCWVYISYFLSFFSLSLNISK